MNGLPENTCILIVEDEAILAWMIKDVVTDMGGTVMGPTGRVQQTLNLLTLQTPTAAVLDVNLHGTHSEEVARLLTARNIPFLVSSGYNHADLGESYAAGIPLSKPYSAETLRLALMKLPLRRTEWLTFPPTRVTGESAVLHADVFG